MFVGGAVGMMLELAGSRLLAPYFGNSLFVWTSLIGVMLGFMSLGYYFGGRLADRRLDAGLLFWILIGAAISVSLLTFIESTVLAKLSGSEPEQVVSVLASVALFAVPSTLLGMVSPYCIRLRMHHIEDSGATVGSLYALSTLGSIVGTFAAGFWLLSVLGTRDLIALLGTILAVLSLFVIEDSGDWRRLAALGAVTLMVAASFAGVAEGIETIDTQYDRYYVREVRDPVTGKLLIGLSRDEYSAESASYKSSGEPYRFEYYDYYDLAAVLDGPVQRALLIGGGTFSYPRLFVRDNPDAVMDVVEIDPALLDIARERFGYRDDPRIRIFLEDGRTFLNRATGPYDAVFIDAFKSVQTVPYQLTTLETWRRCYDVLDEDGMVVMNVIASPDDDRARFFHALYATVDEVFPNVAAFKVQEDGSGRLQNTIIVAAKDPTLDIAEAVKRVAPEYSEHLLAGYEPPAGARILTDDFAPVDQYLLGF